MSEKKEGKTRYGTIVRICPLHAYGGEGNDPVARVEHDGGGIGEYPLPSGLEFQQGQRISVTPVTEMRGEKGGSITTFQISPKAAEFLFYYL